MIDPDKRKAVFLMHSEGMSIREISRRLKISRPTVRTIIRQGGQMPQTVRKDKMHIDPDLLRRLYHECHGWIQRVHEKLQEEEGIQVGYRIVNLETLRRIAWLCMQQDEHPLPEADVDENFQQRLAYQEGCLTEEPDLSIYDAMFGEEDEDQDDDLSAESEEE